MSALAKFARNLHARKAPRYIYKGAMRGFGPEHRYRVFDREGREVTSFVCDPETAKELARRDKLEPISAQGLRGLPKS